MSDENWISRKVNQIEGTLDFKWIKVLKGLNIGNRALFKGHNDILHEDVLESRQAVCHVILVDGFAGNAHFIIDHLNIQLTYKIVTI